MSAKSILEFLPKEITTNPEIKIPTDSQLYNYTAAQRKKVGPSQMNFDELRQWCIERRNVPENLNEPFVVSYQINIDGDDAENFPPTFQIQSAQCVYSSRPNLYC